jgi:hypothetical protein
MTMAVPMTSVAMTPQPVAQSQPVAAPATTQTDPVQQPVQPVPSIGYAPQPTYYYAPVPMYYPTYYNPLLDIAVGVGAFRMVFGGHHHH